MPTRREFLQSASVTLLMIPLTACSSGPPAEGANDDAGTCENGVLTTSTYVSEHTHTLCVPESDLSSPPSTGATYTSSNDLDPLNNEYHTHTVTLSAQQLSTIYGGAQVTVTSSDSDSHTHQFTIVQNVQSPT